MNDYSWDNDDLKMICGQYHYKDEDPEMCHAVEPPIKKPFVPNNTSSCCFLRESYWERITKDRQDEFEAERKRRSERYYHKNNN